ncbi:MAG: sigma-54 dependent transcriptional regulator [Spirochaetes bacterium]|nr:sigma-54 dependent transcriptional regulator [Spirochaetota bacterium]MBU1082369.1 sigma-54 dependent transcriptional regulator [Spirochaetota bacterium]
MLIIDDEKSICVSLSLALQVEFDVSWESSPLAAMDYIRGHHVALVLLDMVIGETDGIEVLKAIKEYNRDIAVIMMTAFGDIRSSVSAMKLGAFNYLPKPLDIEELQIHIRQALEMRRLNAKVDYLSHQLTERYQHGIVGGSPSIRRVYELIDKLKDVDSPVAITGESGTGKELVAKAIHYSGKRKTEPFVAINCSAIPEGLFEGEFFGHMRGSFTGAISNQVGKLESVGGGTIMLDEIGDLPLGFQGKLLRVLQEKNFTPIGSNKARSLEARVIAATNRNIPALIAGGQFREDLYYRINVVEIKMSPLRDRKADIPALCEYFIKKNNVQQSKQVKGLTRKADDLLRDYDYPGNVRELANALEYASIVCDGEWIGCGDLPDRMTKAAACRGPDAPDPRGKSLREAEREVIEAAYSKHDGRRSEIARELGISERGLWNKLKEYGLIGRDRDA